MVARSCRGAKLMGLRCWGGYSEIGIPNGRLFKRDCSHAFCEADDINAYVSRRCASLN